MNGWWWNPDEPGRGFFVEYRDGRVCVACCLYGEGGRAEWHWVGPLELGPGDRVAGESRRMRLAGAPREAQAPLPFALEFASASKALLEWGGMRLTLEPQHAALREPQGCADEFLTGAWIERDRAPSHALVCEHLGNRAFAVLLVPDGWLLLDAVRRAPASYEGKWWRFEGGQTLGGAHRAPSGREVGSAGRIAWHSDGTVLVVLPDGSQRAFDRPPFASDGAGVASHGERVPRSVDVGVSTDAARRPRSGLAVVAFEIAARSFADCSYRLTLSAPGAAEPLFAKDFRLTGWSRRVDLLVNTHLLPNGDVRLAAHLAREGATAWSGEVTLRVSNAGPLAERVRESLRTHGSPLVIEGLVDSAHYDMANRALRPWFEQPGALGELDRLRSASRITTEEAQALRQFVEEGYLVVPAAIEEPLLARIDRELDDAVAAKVQGYEYGSSQRIRNLHQRYAGIQSLWRHPAVMRHLELIFGVPARPCQTLTYVFGSQQEAHQDTVHLTPFPAGYMCGVWVALEDVRPDSGELVVFPGTHRLPRIYMADARCAKVTSDDWEEFGEKVVGRYREMLARGGFGKVTYRPKRGTVLIWHENLLHGGSVRLDTTLSRRSIVSHYFADGAVAFYDSSGLPGNMD